MSPASEALTAGISASEKYAEIEAAGLERPVCECHGEQMRWGKASRPGVAGYWVCLVKSRAAIARWTGRQENKPKRKRHKDTFRAKHLEEIRTKDREKRRRQLGWYDEGGMATEPLRVKELT